MKTINSQARFAAKHPKRWKQIHDAAQRRYRQTPKGKFAAHRGNAITRGIEFLLTFEQWWALWEKFWNKRGANAKGYVMARYNDTGPYALGNVEIIPHTKNASDAWRYRRD